MKYKVAPIFKYIILLIVIFMFIKHLEILNNNQDLLITLSIMFIIISFDYVLIECHPDLLNSNETFVDDIVVNNEDIEEIINTHNQDDEKDLDNTAPTQIEYPDRRANYQLPTDFSQPSYDLDEDCYRRGDGRGNNANVNKHYMNEVL